VSQISALFPTIRTPICSHLNGPFSRKSTRGSGMVAAGYDNFYRYQLGLPVWRALGNTVQSILKAFAYIFNRDHTAVFVDARISGFPSRYNHLRRNIQPAKRPPRMMMRLPLLDKGAPWSFLADDLNWPRKSQPKSPESLLEPAAISAARSRTWKTATSASIAPRRCPRHTSCRNR